MSHHIQAFIGSKAALAFIRSVYGESKVVDLAQGLALLPVTDELYNAIPSIGPISRSDDGFKFLDAKIEKVLVDNSKSESLGYIETDYFGGCGDQGAITAKNGAIVFGPQRGSGAINQALRLLSVESNGIQDEFDTVGLGRFRDNEDWINQPSYGRPLSNSPTILGRMRDFLLRGKTQGRS